MKEYEQALQQANAYLDLAERHIENKSEPYNPAAVNCIMAMIKTIDAAYLKTRGYLPKSGGRGHEQTAQKLQELYEDGDISESFSANTSSVQEWVVDKKSDIQYKNTTVSKADAQRCLKAAKRLHNKMKNELS